MLFCLVTSLWLDTCPHLYVFQSTRNFQAHNNTVHEFGERAAICPTQSQTVPFGVDGLWDLVPSSFDPWHNIVS